MVMIARVDDEPSQTPAPCSVVNIAPNESGGTLIS